MSKGVILTIILISITFFLYLLNYVVNGYVFTLDFRTISHIFAYTATTLISLEFIISSRLKFLEEILNGLDKVYNFHHKLGKFAFIFIILHPLFLIFNAIPNTDIIRLYLLPSSIPGYSLGVLTLYSFVLLLMLSIFIKLPYNFWKYTHNFMGVPLVTLFLHFLLINTSTSNFQPLRIWLLSLLSIALILFIYKRFIYENIKNIYSVSEVKVIKSITKVVLRPQNIRLVYQSGQFIFIRFPFLNSLNELHPFTLASKPSDNSITLYVRNLGDYTYRLKDLKVGDVAYIYGPYGRFNKAIEKNNSLWIAGGIGITPFLSRDLNKEEKSNISLHYITNKEEDVMFNHLLDLKINFEKFNNLKEYIGKERNFNNFNNIVLCGPKGLIKELLKFLKEIKYPQQNIYYEVFELYE